MGSYPRSHRVRLAPECPKSQHGMLSTIFCCCFKCEAEQGKAYPWARLALLQAMFAVTPIFREAHSLLGFLPWLVDYFLKYLSCNINTYRVRGLYQKRTNAFCEVETIFCWFSLCYWTFMLQRLFPYNLNFIARRDHGNVFVQPSFYRQRC